MAMQTVPRNTKTYASARFTMTDRVIFYRPRTRDPRGPLHAHQEGTHSSDLCLT